jgi:hypothetical protein
MYSLNSLAIGTLSTSLKTRLRPKCAAKWSKILPEISGASDRRYERNIDVISCFIGLAFYSAVIVLDAE